MSPTYSGISSSGMPSSKNIPARLFTWSSIVDEYQRRLSGLGDSTSTDEEALNIEIDIITNCISSTDKNVYWNFDKFYRASKRELGV
jgi:hypothetical protein